MLKIIKSKINRFIVSLFTPICLLVVLLIIEPPTDIYEVFLSWYFWNIVGAIFASVFIFLTALFHVLSEKHEGWKRIALLLGPLGGIAFGIVGAYYSDFFGFWELFCYVFWGVTIGLSVVPVCRGFTKWILEGFKNTSQKS